MTKQKPSGKPAKQAAVSGAARAARGKTKRRFLNTYVGTRGTFYAGSVYELSGEELAVFKNDTEEAR